MIKMAIVDDNEEILGFLKKKIHQHYGDIMLIKTIPSINDFYNEIEYNGNNEYDIILMDIMMGDKTGVELANDYLAKHQRSKMIFITAHAELSPEVFKSKPAGLVHKPIKDAKLFEAIDRAMQTHNEDLNEYIKIETKTQIYNIAISDIRYVESEGHYLSIYKSGDNVSVNMKLSEFDAMVENVGPKAKFIRCHQSYSVNAKYITSFGNNSIVLVDGVNIPVSRNKQSVAKEAFLEYLGRNV